MILARWLATNPRVLILDEPTRGIDVGAKAEIQRLVLDLAREGKACVFISSELGEVVRSSHRIVVMGAIINYAKVQPFIVTLAGMFFARGLCFVISVEAITITHPFYRAVSKLRIPMPLLGKTLISVNVVIFLVIMLLVLYLLHLTALGRSIYAIGGNEQSARLMGFPWGAPRYWSRRSAASARRWLARSSASTPSPATDCSSTAWSWTGSRRR